MALDVRLRWALIDERIEARGGMMAVTARARLDRSTISRWRRQGKLPDDPLRFLRLAEALDVDPLLLFELEGDRFPDTCRRIGRLLITGRIGRALGSLTFLEDFWRAAGGEWPPKEIRNASGKDFIQYAWVPRGFRHEGQLDGGHEGRNFYASIELESGRVATRSAPQVWHFAYRDPLEWAAAWHPYGSVALVGTRLELYSYAGRVTMVEAPGPIAVETWLGEGDADFRIASLHPFELDLQARTRPGHAAVRFELPRVAWAR